jgi:RNA 2',3'-cyclic 3'-phosphodiesterase
MARGSLARLFVALDLPPALCADLASWARSAASAARASSLAALSLEPPPPPPSRRSPSDARAPRPRPRARRAPDRGRLRLLAPSSLHLTLLFLGPVLVSSIDAVALSLTAVCAEAAPLGQLSVGAPLWLPPRRPRALAVEVHDDPSGGLSSLARALAAALAPFISQAPPAAGAGGGRGVSPRALPFRPHITVARLHAGDAPADRTLPATPPSSFLPGSVSLLRSWLSASEARYETLAGAPLAARADPAPPDSAYSD